MHRLCMCDGGVGGRGSHLDYLAARQATKTFPLLLLLLLLPRAVTSNIETESEKKKKKK
jgi:hypothetical protein